jgi:hypothetical protein
VGFGFDEDHARSILSPLHELHNLRNQVKGHATGDEARKARASALSAHGSYRMHFQALCSLADESLRQIGEAFGRSSGS